MDNKQFDDIIKKKLESLNTNGSEDAWNLFKEKWDSKSFPEDEPYKASEEDLELDAKIKKDLGDLRIPFNSKHWIILKEQLELEALFKKKLFVAKSIELVVLAFLVLGILNVWPIQQNIYKVPMYDIPMVPSISVDKATAEQFELKEQARLKEQSELFESTKTIFKNSSLSIGKLTSNANSRSEKFIEAIPNSRVKSENTILKSSLDPAKSLIPFINLHNELVDQESLDSDIVKPVDGPIAQMINSEIKELDIPVRPIGYPDIVLNNKLNKEEENTYLSFAVGPRVNLINSPFDPVYGFDPYNTINTNFNISAKVNKEIGPIELYAGLGYTNTSYVPRLVDEIYEPLESQFNVATLENIKFKTFNIPVGVKYNVLESKNYQLYASAGVDLNIIADSEYVIQDVPLGRPSPAGPPPNPANLINENSKLSQKEFNQGILSGGSLKDNLYASASIGLGLNLNITSESGIFIEPRYSHFISSKGIGPNEDKVHGLSIDLGVRYQLN